MKEPSVLSQPRVANYPERGARLARREERAYREYVSDEQRSQAGCPARRIVKCWLGQDTSGASYDRPGISSYDPPGISSCDPPGISSCDPPGISSCDPPGISS